MMLSKQGATPTLHLNSSDCGGLGQVQGGGSYHRHHRENNYLPWIILGVVLLGLRS